MVNEVYTHILRRKWGKDFKELDKDRATHYHHAVDATLCAISPFVTIDPYQYVYCPDKNEYRMKHKDSDESMTITEYKSASLFDLDTYTVKWFDFRAQLSPSTFFPRVKFLHQINAKADRKVSDGTLYSTRMRKITKQLKKA